MPALDRAVGWIDAPVADVLGRPIGRVKAVLCDSSGRPWWLELRLRGFRGRTVLAPVEGAVEEDGVRLAYRAELLAGAPQPEGVLTAEGHSQLAAYFGLGTGGPRFLRRRGDCQD